MPNSIQEILVVEDNEADFFLLNTYFDKIKGNKYNLTWANSPQKALKEIKDREFDLCILDYSISPDENGIEFANRAGFKEREIPCILLTGYDDIDPYDMGEDSSIFDYLLKHEINPSLLNRSLIYALQRKKSETDLKKAKAYTSHIVNSIPLMIIQTDKKGIIRQSNPASTIVSGFETEELIGKNILDLIASDEQEKASNTLLNSVGGYVQMKLTAKSLEEKLISWNTIHSSVDDIIIIGKDVTLEMLERENEQQRQKMEALGQLAGGVAHEVNNLLQPILLLGEISKDDLGVDNKIVEENLDIMVDNAEKASEIVKDILSFARQEQEIPEHDKIEKNIRESIKFATELLPKTIMIEADFEDGLSGYECTISRTDMIKIFSNLMINAALAMDNKGRIDIKTRRRTLDTAQGSALKIIPGDYFYISLKDEGCGIPEEVIEKIFNPFFTTREVGKGTGLGLSIVYSIIQKDGGTITVSSKVGKGTTFEIFIPIH